MAYPDPNTEPLSIRALQQWTLTLLLRRFLGYVVGLTLLDLATMYSLVIAVVLLLSGLSGDFLGKVFNKIPALAATPLADPSASFVLSAAMFALHVGSGWLGALMQRRFSVALETWLRLGVLSNSAMWLAPRTAFASGDGPERRAIALAGRARSVVRSGRAMVNILPSLIFLASAVVSLLVLFPAALIWLLVMAVVSVVVQRAANKRIVGLEKGFARITSAFKATSREHAALYNKSAPTADELARRAELDFGVSRFSSDYFTRNTLSQLTRYASFGSMTMVSFGFLALLLLTHSQLTEGALVETFVLLMVVARTIVGSIAGVAANQAVLAKFSVHAHQTFLYFHGPRFRKPEQILPKTRLLGPIVPGPYGVSFYLDAINEKAGTDLRQFKGAIIWDEKRQSLVLDPKGQAIAYKILPVELDVKTDIDLREGDIIVMYSRLVSIKKARTLNARTYRQMMRRDIRRVLARPREEIEEIEADPMFDEEA